MAVAALAALAYVIAVLVACHIIRRDVDPFVQPISAYALGRGGIWFALALAAWGASGWFVRTALRGSTNRFADVLIALFALGLLTAAVFPMDVPFPPTEWTVRKMSWLGVLHVAGASVSSIVFPVASWLLSSRFAPARALSTIAALSGMAAVAVFVLPFVDVRFFGLAQRLLAVLILAWLVTASLSLLRR